MRVRAAICAAHFSCKHSNTHAHCASPSVLVVSQILLRTCSRFLPYRTILMTGEEGYFEAFRDHTMKHLNKQQDTLDTRYFKIAFRPSWIRFCVSGKPTRLFAGAYWLRLQNVFSETLPTDVKSTNCLRNVRESIAQCGSVVCKTEILTCTTVLA